MRFSLIAATLIGLTAARHHHHLSLADTEADAPGDKAKIVAAAKAAAAKKKVELKAASAKKKAAAKKSPAKKAPAKTKKAEAPAKKPKVVKSLPTQKQYEDKAYIKTLKDPNVRARFNFANDKCRKYAKGEKKYKCFKKSWTLFKPHKKNKLLDVRARAQRACWKYKNKPEKRSKCYKKYIKQYEDVLKKGLLAHVGADQKRDLKHKLHEAENFEADIDEELERQEEKVSDKQVDEEGNDKNLDL